jgi:hypothetical protein
LASEIDICNLALGHLGDDASVSSISPPEGSAQAEHCARFYPAARDALLELHPWGFATKRAPLTQLAVTPPSQWAYVYQEPNDALNLLEVYAPDASDDYSAGFLAAASHPQSVNTGTGIYTPQTFVEEIAADGSQVIYSNQQNAILRYTARVTDTTKFSPLFVIALSWLLASDLAGPILKGQTGAQAAASAYKTFSIWFSKATVSDANQRRSDVKQSVPWMVNR